MGSVSVKPPTASLPRQIFHYPDLHLSILKLDVRVGSGSAANLLSSSPAFLRHRACSALLFVLPSRLISRCVSTISVHVTLPFARHRVESSNPFSALFSFARSFENSRNSQCIPSLFDTNSSLIQTLLRLLSVVFALWRPSCAQFWWRLRCVSAPLDGS